jgi:lipid-binding SYLF domain-containing protein
MKRMDDTIMKYLKSTVILLIFVFSAATFIDSKQAAAASAGEINRQSEKVLKKLYAQSMEAKELGEKAKGILVFPVITKGGFMVGGLFGDGVLMKEGKTIGYYRNISVSYGLQAGLQKYSYVMFFMTDSALGYLDKSDGWELGTGPSIVIVDKGVARGLSTTTARPDVYAFFLNQKGLMAGLGLQGTKITGVNKY